MFLHGSDHTNIEQASAVYSTYFYRKITEFLETIFTVYGPCIKSGSGLHWAEKTLSRTCRMKSIFLCAGVELKPLVTEIRERISGLGLAVVHRTLDPDTAFLHVTDTWTSNTLVFWRKDGSLGIVVLTKMKSGLKDKLPVWISALAMLTGILVFFPLLIDLMGMRVATILLFGVAFVFFFLCEWGFLHPLLVKSSKSISDLMRDILETTESCKVRFGGRSPFKVPPRITHDVIDMVFKILNAEKQHSTI